MSYTTITTIIAALVAVLVLYKLYSVLGKRTGNERPRTMGIGKPFTKTAESSVVPARPFAYSPEGGGADPNNPNYANYPKSLAAQLREVGEVDSSFNEREFLLGAKTAFNDIVAAFRHGDLSGVEKWVSPEVIDSLRTSLPKTAAARHEAADSGIKAINEIEVLQAQINGTRILLTVLIRSHQGKDSLVAEPPKVGRKKATPKKADLATDASPAGQKAMAAQSGEVGEEMVDIWTFARDIHSNNPNWQLVSTRSPV